MQQAPGHILSSDDRTNEIIVSHLHQLQLQVGR